MKQTLLHTDCAVIKALSILGGKWKLPIMKRLMRSTLRYNELFHDLDTISQRMLTKQLRELEHDGLIARKIYPEIPPKVEYSLTPVGRNLKKVISELEKWGKELSS